MPRKIVPLNHEEEIISNNYYNWLLSDIYSINTYRIPIEKFLRKKMDNKEFDRIKASRLYFEYCYKNCKRFNNNKSLRAEILRNVSNKLVENFIILYK